MIVGTSMNQTNPDANTKKQPVNTNINSNNNSNNSNNNNNSNSNNSNNETPINDPNGSIANQKMATALKKAEEEKQFRKFVEKYELGSRGNNKYIWNRGVKEENARAFFDGRNRPGGLPSSEVGDVANALINLYGRVINLLEQFGRELPDVQVYIAMLSNIDEQLVKFLKRNPDFPRLQYDKMRDRISANGRLRSLLTSASPTPRRNVLLNTQSITSNLPSTINRVNSLHTIDEEDDDFQPVKPNMIPVTNQPNQSNATNAQLSKKNAVVSKRRTTQRKVRF